MRKVGILEKELRCGQQLNLRHVGRLIKRSTRFEKEPCVYWKTSIEWEERRVFEDTVPSYLSQEI